MLSYYRSNSADSYIVVYVFLGYFSSFLYLIYDSDGKKPRNAAVALANLMDYSIATPDSEIIFLLIGKAIHEIDPYVCSICSQ